MTLRQLAWVFPALLLCIPFSGCGGGGGAGGGAVGTGDVTVLIADGPADAYESIFLTIHEVSLLPSAGRDPVVLYRSADGQQVDLLDLRDEDLVLTVAGGVPAGSYRKVRLEVSDVYTQGGPCDDLTVRLPSGRIDLHPRSNIFLGVGDMLSLRLDIDANKSIQLHPAGNSGMCIFRPVVFVDVVREETNERCARSARGVIAQLMEEAGETSGLLLDLGTDRGALEVAFGAELGYFGGDGLPADPGGLAVGQAVTVRGELDDRARLVALAIVDGNALEVDGVVTSVTDPGQFVFTPEPGGIFAGDVDVVTYPETAIVVDCQATTSDSILAGRSATVVGRIALADSELRAAVVDLGPAEVRGELLSVTEVAEGVQVTFLPEGGLSESTYLLPTGLSIHLEGDGPLEPSLLAEILACGPRGAVVELDLDDATQVDSVTVAADEIEGVVESVDGASRELTILGEAVHVQLDATILAVGDDQRPIPFEEIEIGDTIRAFGLATCPGEEPDFEGFVLLVGEAPPPMDGEGCGVGFWKNHPEDWPTTYPTDTLFDDVFHDSFPGLTLLQVLQQGGGGLNSLGRHTVAALLNGASDAIDYPLSSEAVVELFDEEVGGSDDGESESDVIDHDADDADDADDEGNSSDDDDLKSFFENLNEADCPL